MATFTDLTGTANTFTDKASVTSTFTDTSGVVSTLTDMASGSISDVIYDTPDFNYDSAYLYYDFALINYVLTNLMGTSTTFTDITGV